MCFQTSAPGMDSHRLPNDQPIFDQLPDLLMAGGTGNFISLTGIQPDLLFATVEDPGGKTLLSLSILMAAAAVAKKKKSIFFSLMN